MARAKKMCVLCRKDDDAIVHLLVHCSIKKEIWKEALQLTRDNSSYQGIYVAIYLDKWFKNKAVKNHRESCGRSSLQKMK
jgi:hypothetical protein